MRVQLIRHSLIQLGKYGSFPANLLLGLHYDITYEVYTDPTATIPTEGFKQGNRAESGKGGASSTFGQAKGKKSKKGKEKEDTKGEVKSNPGWSNMLRPLRREEVLDAVVGELFEVSEFVTCRKQLIWIDDIVETNEFIDDTDTIQQELLTQDEIASMRAQGLSAEDIMKAQIARHERFGLKTDFSKEKWRKRKEKK